MKVALEKNKALGCPPNTLQEEPCRACEPQGLGSSRHLMVASCGKQHGAGLSTQAQGGQELPKVHLQKQYSPSHRVEHAPKAMEEGNWRDTGDRSPAGGLPDVTDTCHPSSFFPLPGPHCLTGPPLGATYVWVSLTLCGLQVCVPTSGVPHVLHI